MQWVANRGQVLQISLQIITLLGGATIMAVIVAAVQKVQAAVQDWWLLGSVFVGSMLVMWWAQSLAKKQTVSPQPNIASRDDEKREEVKFFFKTYILPLNKPVLRVESRLRDHLRRSQDGRVRNFMLFVAEYGKGIHGRATGTLENEFVIPENGGIDPLHRKLREFCNTYHGLVDCMNHLIRFSSYPLREDPDYEKWRDQHKLFHLELRKLLGKEKDPSTLASGLDTDWTDIIP